MRKLLTLLAIALGFLAAETSFAQASYIRSREIRRLPPCTESNRGVLMAVRDATNQSTLGSGGGSAATVVICNTTWTPIASTVSAIDGDPSVVIDTDDAGSDVTITPADDLILTVADAATLSAAGVILIDSTAGASVTIDTDAVGSDVTISPVDDLILTAADFLPTATATAVITAPTSSIVASTSLTATTPIFGVSGTREFKVTDVTVADDAAGTKPAGVTPITTDYVTCTCNDATGCTMSVAEPTVTAGYGRLLSIVSTGSGNCEFADSAGVTEIGAAVVLEPTSVLTLVYANAAWHRLSSEDNVP